MRRNELIYLGKNYFDINGVIYHQFKSTGLLGDAGLVNIPYEVLPNLFEKDRIYTLRLEPTIKRVK